MPTPILRIELDYPLSPRPRYGLQERPHPRLSSLLNTRRENYQSTIGAFAALWNGLARIPRLPPSVKMSRDAEANVQAYYYRAKDGDSDARAWFAAIAAEVAEASSPCWLNGYIPGLDAVSLYAFVALNKPKLYVEVGSGNSTKFVRQAISDHRLTTRIVSIDPHPRANIDCICDEIIRAPLEQCDLSVFSRLEAGDILFMDGSHRCLMNSDTTVFFLDVLPSLPHDVLVGIHDIFLPYDYPEGWVDRAYSEQYLLAAYLLAGSTPLEIELPGTYVSRDPALSDDLRQFWARLPAAVDTSGSGFWLRT